MARTFLPDSNPVLLRELRASLRNARSFALLALYVALLGAIVTVNFPASAAIDLQSDGGQKGQALFWALIWGQVGLILTFIPALATGALAQERERQTLEPLLLTPLSPLQIVWGKAGGVLSLIGLLLLASLPLTSLCFLLGGVDPGLLVAAYAGVFGLAIFTTGFGLYCAARWPGATRSMLACYALLPVALALVAVFLPLGSVFSGFCVLAMIFYGLTQGLRKGEKSDFARRIGPLYGKLIYLLVPVLLGGILLAMYFDRNIGLMATGIGFVLAYFVMAGQWGLLQTARELMLRNDPEAPMRQKIADFKSDWQNAVAAPAAPTTYTPTPQSQGEWAAVSTSLAASKAVSATAQTKKADKDKDSYGKAPFLSDKLNPIYARELRSGLLGRWETLFRFSYIAGIASELLLFFYLLASINNPSYITSDYSDSFAVWGRWHAAIVMLLGTWFGARAIAPEREGQTLAQLFTIPLPSRQIIGGKMAAVLTFTFYVQVLVLPMALLLPLTSLVPWAMTLRFIVVETILGILAASWGVYCSFHSMAVRRAIMMSLSGTLALLGAHALILPLADIAKLLGLTIKSNVISQIAAIFPIPLLFANQTDALTTLALNSQTISQKWTPLATVFYALLAVLLLAKTARDFSKLARET